MFVFHIVALSMEPQVRNQMLELFNGGSKAVGNQNIDLEDD